MKQLEHDGEDEGENCTDIPSNMKNERGRSRRRNDDFFSSSFKGGIVFRSAFVSV
jgi:hypothetical protein